jgi:hypothetical protein
MQKVCVPCQPKQWILSAASKINKCDEKKSFFFLLAKKEKKKRWQQMNEIN